GLEHDPAHHRRYRRWCGGMGLRQPRMHGNQSCLGPETQQCKQECGSCPKVCERSAAHRVEGELPAATLHHPETEQDAEGAHMSHHEIQKAGTTDFRNTVL